MLIDFLNVQFVLVTWPNGPLCPLFLSILVILLISSSLITKFGLHTSHHHHHQELPNKDDNFHASSFWTNLKTITGEILVLVWINVMFVTKYCSIGSI